MSDLLSLCTCRWRGKLTLALELKGTLVGKVLYRRGLVPIFNFAGMVQAFLIIWYGDDKATFSEVMEL